MSAGVLQHALPLRHRQQAQTCQHALVTERQPAMAGDNRWCRTALFLLYSFGCLIAGEQVAVMVCIGSTMVLIAEFM
jgi:hypothetical protein